MIDEEAYENNPIVYFTGRSSRGSIRLADPRRNENLYRCDHPAAPFPTAAPIPHRVEHFVRLDGLWQRQNMDVHPLSGEKQSPESIRHSTGLQFLLEPDLFQRPSFWLFFFLATDAVGVGTADDPGFS